MLICEQLVGEATRAATSPLKTQTDLLSRHLDHLVAQISRQLQIWVAIALSLDFNRDELLDRLYLISCMNDEGVDSYLVLRHSRNPELSALRHCEYIGGQVVYLGEAWLVKSKHIKERIVVQTGQGKLKNAIFVRKLGQIDNLFLISNSDGHRDGSRGHEIGYTRWHHYHYRKRY